MSKIRRQKRELERLSKKPTYIKKYNKKVRTHNEKVRNQKRMDKKQEIIISLVAIAILSGVIAYKLWQKG
jgi:hypothetical protein